MNPWGTNVFKDPMNKVIFILGETQSGLKMKEEVYSKNIRDIKFEKEEKILLKVSPMKGVM